MIRRARRFRRHQCGKTITVLTRERVIKSIGFLLIDALGTLLLLRLLPMENAHGRALYSGPHELLRQGTFTDKSDADFDQIATDARKTSLDDRTLNDPEQLVREEREATRAAIQEPEGKDEDFPDGGFRAWLVVLGVSTDQLCVYSSDFSITH